MSKLLRVSGIILLFGILLTTLLPTSGSRTEATSGDYGKIFTSANQQTCADARCRTIHKIPGDTWVHTWCWRDGGVYNGTQLWFRIHYSGRDGWVNGSKMNPQPKVPYCSNLASGEALYANEMVKSPNGTYQLIMQKDGNLVEYGPGRAAMWASNTDSPGSWAIMQGDGNLVVYTSKGTSVFATGTGWSRAQLVVQSDSNVVIYTASTPRWASSWHVYTGQATRKWNAAAAGNCTWYAMRRWQSFWRRHLYPAFNGNASNWGKSARALKYRVFKFPVTQAIVVFPASKAHKFGHVAWVDEMQPRYGGTWIHIWEMNFLHLYDIHNRWIKVTPQLSFIPASAI